MDPLQFETFAGRLRAIGCAKDTIAALWSDRWIADVAVLNRRPNEGSCDWAELQAPSEAHAHSAAFWYNRKTGKVWATPTGAQHSRP